MKTKINDVKEFAIGTKIEYNDKLYEVIEGKYCDNCSIANICSNNDVSSGKNLSNVLSRDQRLCIFGDCSNINRADGTDVIFKEIPKTKEQDVYNVAPLYKSNNELMSIQIDIPKDFVIDIENSDLYKGIIRFKNKWLTLEQLYKLVKENNYLTYRSSIKDFRDGKLVALANLMDIARYFNGDWKPDWNNSDKSKYYIRYNTCTYAVDCNYTYNYGNIFFKNKKDAQAVIDNPNVTDILDKIFKG